MEGFYNFHKVPTYTVSTDSTSSYTVSIITNLEAYKTAHGEFRATQLKANTCQVIYDGDKATHFVLSETGEEGITLKNLEELAIAFVPCLKKTKIGNFDIKFDVKLTPAQLGQFYYMITLVNYKYEAKAIEDNKSEFVTGINFIGYGADVLEHEDFKFYAIMAESKAHARDLANGRVNIINTNSLQTIVDDFVKEHPEVKQTKFFGEEVLEQGLRLHYNVGKGSQYPPLFINLTYTGNPDSDEYHALVGKGVIFDLGGSNIKQGPLMYWMFLDKGGACAVYGAFKGIVKAGLKVNVTCSIPFAENCVDGNSYRTSDIIKSHSGKTVEIINTDAEGRLLLCDAMSWTQQNYKCNSLIELSTLTGASIVALGHEYAALMTNHDCLVKELTTAGTGIRENIWRLPLQDRIRKRLKQSPADLRHYSGSRDAGTIEAGCFLENFAHEGVRWAHVDIAAAFINLDGNIGPYLTKGGTGFGVGFLMEHFRKLSKNA